MVAFDNTILSLPMFPDAELRQGSGGQKVEYARECAFRRCRSVIPISCRSDRSEATQASLSVKQ
jgi:hypothetical protein